MLFSGSKDTTIIAYDLIASSSLFKLTRHKDVITSLLYYNYGYFSQDPAYAKYQNLKVIISSSKDSLIRVLFRLSHDFRSGILMASTRLTPRSRSPAE